MDLLVAYRGDAAGMNMAGYFMESMTPDGPLHRGKEYDLCVIDTPAISADWIEEEYPYDGYVFLSRHAAESGQLALTCHSTGNFAEARFGGNPRQVAAPHALLQKRYMKNLWQNRKQFEGFDITLEATHHGPTALGRPSMFVEVGTTPRQWSDVELCRGVAAVLERALSGVEERPDRRRAVGFGGTHYPGAFTKMVLEGEYALGTIVPRRALEFIDEPLLYHILQRNDTGTALLDWGGMGPHRRRIVSLLEGASVEMIRI